MKRRSSSVALRHILPIVPILLAITIFPVLAWQPNITSTSDQDNENRPLLPALEREELKRSVRPPRPDSRLPIGVIIDDFRHLQLLNNQVREEAAKQDAVYKKLVKPLGDIRKRAKRLKVGLALSEIAIKNGESEEWAKANLNHF